MAVGDDDIVIAAGASEIGQAVWEAGAQPAPEFYHLQFPGVEIRKAGGDGFEAGLHHRSPLLAMTLMVSVFSLAGIPQWRARRGDGGGRYSPPLSDRIGQCSGRRPQRTSV